MSDLRMECLVVKTMPFTSASGFIEDDRVTLVMDNGQCRPLEKVSELKNDCCGLIRICADGKWGFADLASGKIVVPLVWDFSGPFSDYDGYAHVALGCQVKEDSYYPEYPELYGGKHNYINRFGDIILPKDYCDAREAAIGGLFEVKLEDNGKWGIVDTKGSVVISAVWDVIIRKKNLFFCGHKIEDAHWWLAGDWKWQVFDHNGESLFSENLDEEPTRLIRQSPHDISYYRVQSGRTYGVLCSDGRVLARPGLGKMAARQLALSYCE